MKNLITILFVLASHFIYCQTSHDWVLFKTISGIEFYKKETNCTPENIPNQIGVLIKVVNTNDETVSVSWELNIWYDGVQHKANIKDGENEYTLKLGQNESVQGDCNTPNGALYIFKEFTTFTGGSQMTRFEFTNIKLHKD